jgi:NADPH-dependent 2,4-dienoyl-CoA reductase/sulfur reductase-like enzyme
MRDMKTKVVIGGGGFAGFDAAMYLDKPSHEEVKQPWC